MLLIKSVQPYCAPSFGICPKAIACGNQRLKPQRSSSMKFGFKQKLYRRQSIHIFFFKTVVKDSIDFVYLWNKNKSTDSLTYSDYCGDTYVNIGTQTNQGFEVGASSKLSAKLNLSANVSLENGRLGHDPSNVYTSHSHGNLVQLFSKGTFLNKQVQKYNLVRRP
jgi:vitamin B12 transporter